MLAFKTFILGEIFRYGKNFKKKNQKQVICSAPAFLYYIDDWSASQFLDKMDILSVFQITLFVKGNNETREMILKTKGIYFYYYYYRHLVVPTSGFLLFNKFLL